MRLNNTVVAVAIAISAGILTSIAIATITLPKSNITANVLDPLPNVTTKTQMLNDNAEGDIVDVSPIKQMSVVESAPLVEVPINVQNPAPEPSAIIVDKSSSGSNKPITERNDGMSKTGDALRASLTPDGREHLKSPEIGITPKNIVTVQKPTTRSIRQSDDTSMVYFNGTNVELTSMDNNLLDEIAVAALDAKKVHLLGRSSIGDKEERKARAIARARAVRQALIFHGVDKKDIRIFYRTKSLSPTENNERVDVQLLPKNSD